MQGLAAWVDRYELAEGKRLAAKLNVVACDGPCLFPQCLIYGCPGEPADVDADPASTPPEGGTR